MDKHRSTRRAFILTAAAWPALAWAGAVLAQSKQPILIGCGLSKGHCLATARIARRSTAVLHTTWTEF